MKECDEKNKKPIVKSHVLLPAYAVPVDFANTSHLETP